MNVLTFLHSCERVNYTQKIYVINMFDRNPNLSSQKNALQVDAYRPLFTVQGGLCLGGLCPGGPCDHNDTRE